MQILDVIISVFTNPIVQGIITAIAALAVTQWARYSIFYKAIVDIVRVYGKAKDPKSPGGKKLTAEEYAAIGEKVVKAIQAGAPLLKKKT